MRNQQSQACMTSYSMTPVRLVAVAMAPMTSYRSTTYVDSANRNPACL